MNSSRERLVVVGASLAGTRAAEAARAHGFIGTITLIGDEIHLPYDRPSLSKDCLANGGSTDPVAILAADALQNKGIDLALGEPATYLDTTEKVVGSKTGEYPFSAAVIATGSAPVHLPGADRLTGIHVLRTLDDARAVRSALDTGARTVVIGGGFIGAEVASAARKRELPVAIVEAAPAPLVRAVGTHMGGVLARMHGRYGTDLICGVGVTGFKGDQHVEAVILADGRCLDADLVVVGVGSRPATAWLQSSGLDITDGIVCDEFLHTSGEGVYAAGDVARWRNALFDRDMRIEHYTAAAEQGARAARNAIDPLAAHGYVTVPYFWSDWYGNRIQFVGVTTEDFHLASGSFDGDHFVVLYRLGARIVGALTLNGQRHIMKYRRMVAQRSPYEEATAFARSQQQRVS